jgi:hypothetical protein
MNKVLLTLTVLLVAACGGGRSTTSVNTLAGTVATGAPMVGATVEVYNASGTKVGSGTTDSNGDYKTSALLGAGPYVIKATLGARVLYSVQASDDGKPVNVNTLSNLVATLASPTGNPDSLVSEMAADKTILSTSAITSKKDIVKEIVSPVSKVLGLDFDVINTAMKADGTGIDRVLDTVKISYTPTTTATTIQSVTTFQPTTTIQVAYISGAVDSTPQTITFNSKNTIVSVNGVTYTNGDLFDTTLTKDIQAWAARTNRCIRTPVKERWKLLPSGVKEFIAEDCKKLWWNNDHTQVFVWGYRAQDMWENEFADKNYTEDSLTEAEYVYTTAADEIIVKGNAKVYKDDGVTPYQRYYFVNLKRDPVSKELKTYGNKYIYETTINSNNYIRYFPYSPDYNFTFSGYGIDIPITATRGNHLLNSIPYPAGKEVASAVVTAPDGSKTYLKAGGEDNLSLCTDSSCGTLIVGGLKIIRSDFFNKATDAITTPTHKNAPSKLKPTEYSWNGIDGFQQVSDSVIQNLPMLGTYKFELILADGSKVSQLVPIFGRPKTHSEIMTANSKGVFASLTESSIAGFWRSTKVNSLEFDNDKVLYLFKKKPDGTIDSSKFGTIDLQWNNMAQWIYGSGITVQVPNNDNTTRFTTRVNAKTNESSLSLACSYKTDKSNQKQCLSATGNEFSAGGNNGSQHFSIITYIELGNYFSDFGANVTSYGFYAIEESP